MIGAHNSMEFWTKGMNQLQKYNINKILRMGFKLSFSNNKPKENILDCFDLFMFRHIGSNKSFQLKQIFSPSLNRPHK
jgi:hypothetical protein